MVKHQCIYRNAFHFYMEDAFNQLQPEKTVTPVASLAFHVLGFLFVCGVFLLGSCLFGWFWLAVFFLCDKVFSGYNLIMVLVKKKPVLHSYLRIFSQNHHQHHIKYLLRCGLFREGGAFTKLLPLIYQLIIESSTLTFKRG